MIRHGYKYGFEATTSYNSYRRDQNIGKSILSSSIRIALIVNDMTALESLEFALFPDGSSFSFVSPGNIPVTK